MELSPLFRVSDIPVSSLTHNTLGRCVDLKRVCADRPSTLPVVVFISVAHTLVTCQCSRVAVPRHRSPRCSVQHQHRLRRGDNSSHTFQPRQNTHTHRHPRIHIHTHQAGSDITVRGRSLSNQKPGSIYICAHTRLTPVS